MEVVEGDDEQVLLAFDTEVTAETLFLLPVDESLALGGLAVSLSSSKELRLSRDKSASLKTSRRPDPLSS